MNEYEVNVGENPAEYFITFYGPKDSTLLHSRGAVSRFFECALDGREPLG